MNLYLNELAPWERKKEYYHHIQLGKDVRSQTEVIHQQTKAMVATQLASANAIIASQERISEEIGDLSYGIENVAEGIQGLQAAFEWGISEVVWQIEQNRQVLRSILEVLSAPLDTQAKEYKKRADRAYAKGLIEDALIEYLESEKRNRFDFSIHISLGIIYLFHVVDKEKALEYFDKAIKYGRGESDYYLSYALLHKALIKRDLGLLEEAESLAAEACELSPEFSEAFYQNAVYNSLLKNSEKAIYMLTKAISIDKNYCLKADNEEAFKSIDEDLQSLFQELLNVENAKVEKNLSTIQNKQKAIQKIISGENLGESNLKCEIGDGIKKVQRLISRYSYFDALHGNNKLRSLMNLQADYVDEIVDKLQSFANRCRSDRNRIIQKCKAKAESRRIYFSPAGGVLGFLLGVGGCFYQMDNVSSKTSIPGSFFDLIGSVLWHLVSPFIVFGIITAAIWAVFYAVGNAMFPGEANTHDLKEYDQKRVYYEALIGRLKEKKA